MTTRIPKSLITCLLLSAAFPLAAEPLNYDYAYVTRESTDVDGKTTDSDTIGLYYEGGATWHVFGSYGDSGSYAPGQGDVSTDLVRLGGGAMLMFGDRLMFSPQVAWLRGEVTWPEGSSYTDHGFTVLGDVRYLLVDDLELVGGVHYSDLFGSSGTTVTGGAIYHFNDLIAAGALYNRTDDGDGFGLTVRVYY